MYNFDRNSSFIFVKTVPNLCNRMPRVYLYLLTSSCFDETSIVIRVEIDHKCENNCTNLKFHLISGIYVIIGIVVGIIVLLVLGVCVTVLVMRYSRGSALSIFVAASARSTNTLDTISSDYQSLNSGNTINSGYLSVINPSSHGSQPSTGNEYSYVRDPERIMRAIQARYQNRGVVPQAGPIERY